MLLDILLKQVGPTVQAVDRKRGTGTVLLAEPMEDNEAVEDPSWPLDILLKQAGLTLQAVDRLRESGTVLPPGPDI